MDTFYNTIPQELLTKLTTIENPTSLFHLIKKADNSQECHYEIETINKSPPMPSKKENNTYFHDSIQKTIRMSKILFYERITFRIHSKETGITREIVVSFVPIHKSAFHIDKYLHYLVLWFKLMNMLCPNNMCNKKLTIMIYFTNIKKKLPLSNSEKRLITSKHINSAYTYACIDHGEITIYRDEEWFKVLLHECLHSFCMDFTDFADFADFADTKKTNKCGLKILTHDMMYVTNPVYSETYTEVWAELLQCALIAYQDCGNIPSIFSLLFQFYSRLEIVHSLIQANKILSYYGYTFSDVREKKHFKQETHAFEYYILKSLLMLRADTFYKWCLKNNGNNIIPFSRNEAEKNILSFFDLLGNCCSCSQIKKANTLVKKVNPTDKRTLAMSIVGF
jgi:hypothetical protein